MRKVMSALAAMGVSVAVATGISVGCISPAADCREINTCCPDGTMDCFATTTTTTTDGGGGRDSGPPPGCIPSDNVEAVANTCGVFVSSSKGDDTNGKGTKEAPFATITQALANAKGKPVYACGELFDKETVAITEDAMLYGALDCTKGWVYDGAKKAQLAPTMDAIPLSISKDTTSVELYDFAIKSADATQDGGSSIAVLVTQASAGFTRCDVTAGSGKAGIAGAGQTKVMTPASANGTNGGDNAACTVTNNIPGGAGGTNMCDGAATNGGNGGKGIPDANGGQGGDGLPMMTPGNGGTGQTSSTSCNPGTKGSDGSVGMPGTGARGIGDVSASGYQAPTPTAGGSGIPGQGGGGGGGALACDYPANMFSGPSGGGGGAGGCGGAPGNSGQSGGSSIGVVAISATLTLTNVTITAKDGGAGGLGGDGQKGAAGGLGGNAVAVGACAGGPGGQGGPGGPGGGGAGGHSAAIVVKGGKSPNLDGVTLQHGNAGLGGAGGDMDMSAQTRGDDGLGCKTLDFTDPKSATACVK